MRSRHLFLSSILLLSSVSLYSDTIERSNDLSNKDVQALREWINTKRQVTVKEIGGALSISGEVRAEFQTGAETINGIRQRGAGGATSLNDQAFDIEVNLMMDYRADRTWAAIKLEFDNDAGIFSGSFNKIKIEKAYFGARMIDADTYTSDIEIGRRKMGTILDSKLEFTSFFDGIWLKYDQGFEKIGDLYVHLGPFIVNERTDHFAYVGEIGLIDIADLGIYTKFSVIDWDTKHYSNPVKDQMFDFVVGQWVLGYKFVPKKLGKAVILYAAGLYNFEAERLAISDNEKANWGAYAGFSIGELKKKSDWSFDANYQLLAAQAVPDFDVSGIGLGNAPNAGFYTVNVDGSGGDTTKRLAAGNGNYRGFVLTLDYLFSNNLMLEQQYQQSITLNDSIGPFRRFKQYEIEFIYAF